jgi:hypothetical protein
MVAGLRRQVVSTRVPARTADAAGPPACATSTSAATSRSASVGCGRADGTWMVASVRRTVVPATGGRALRSTSVRSTTEEEALPTGVVLATHRRSLRSRPWRLPECHRWTPTHGSLRPFGSCNQHHYVLRDRDWTGQEHHLCNSSRGFATEWRGPGDGRDFAVVEDNHCFWTVPKLRCECHQWRRRRVARVLDY